VCESVELAVASPAALPTGVVRLLRGLEPCWPGVGPRLAAVPSLALNPIVIGQLIFSFSLYPQEPLPPESVLRWNQLGRSPLTIQ